MTISFLYRSVPALAIATACTILPTQNANASDYYTNCARQGEFCEFSGWAEVRFGKNGKFHRGVFKDGTPCNNTVFGNPIGVTKYCGYRPLDTINLTINWSTPLNRENGEDLYNHELKGYEVQYKSSSATEFTSIAIDNVYTTSHTLTLPPENYEIRVKAIDNEGFSSAFSKQTITMGNIQY